ncbi:hypothetical protein SLEP1_g14084 [Rubroshorea leprosula]|uniref:Secreted protein n=1 Tax=Rubroshorea leprosula TaxID=152421 RepID=A0AAV5ISJ2_9ROSI|nr:hypothetical protein SLEP1_g14084 [Rubroshorea leprosula]
MCRLPGALLLPWMCSMSRVQRAQESRIRHEYRYSIISTTAGFSFPYSTDLSFHIYKLTTIK